MLATEADSAEHQSATRDLQLAGQASQQGTIAEIVSVRNNCLTKDVLDSGRFMTLFLLSIYPGQRRLEWVRAGNEPALLYDPDLDTFEELKGSGIALGVI